MQIVCTKENLMNGLQKVRKMTSKSATLSILDSVLIKTEKNRIRLSSTNLEIGINCFVRGKILREGGICLPMKIFFDYINLILDQQIEIKVENSNVFLTSNSLKTNIKGIDQEEFPLIPAIEKKPFVTVEGKTIKKILSRMISVINPEKTRPEISGGLFDFKDKKLTIAATDGSRLVEDIVLLKDLEKESRMIIPLETLQELNRILEKEEGNLEISFSENQIFFQINEVNLLSRLGEGNFPEYKAIIPQEFDIQGKFLIFQFANILKTIGLFSKKETNEVDLRFRLKDKELLISAQSSQIGESSSKIKGEIFGEKDREIKFNYKYFLEGLSSIDDEEVLFKLGQGEISPGVLEPAGKKEQHFYLIMPLKE